MDVPSFLALLALAAVAAGYYAFFPPAVFVVRFRGGKARAVKGVVSAEFLAVIEDICGDYQLKWADIRGVRRHGRLGLWFSLNVPGGCRQRLRNWWACG